MEKLDLLIEQIQTEWMKLLSRASLPNINLQLRRLPRTNCWLQVVGRRHHLMTMMKIINDSHVIGVKVLRFDILPRDYVATIWSPQKVLRANRIGLYSFHVTT